MHSIERKHCKDKLIKLCLNKSLIGLIRKNALIPKKVNMTMVLQRFHKNIERLNKLSRQKTRKIF